jgi:hypothetical protein
LRSDTISGPRIFAVKPAGSHRELTPYRQVQYRRTGAPGRTPSALIDDRVDDPLALLRERLRCEVVLVADRADESGPGDA